MQVNKHLHFKEFEWLVSQLSSHTSSNLRNTFNKCDSVSPYFYDNCNILCSKKRYIINLCYRHHLVFKGNNCLCYNFCNANQNTLLIRLNNSTVTGQWNLFTYKTWRHWQKLQQKEKGLLKHHKYTLLFLLTEKTIIKKVLK